MIQKLKSKVQIFTYLFEQRKKYRYGSYQNVRAKRKDMLEIQSKLLRSADAKMLSLLLWMDFCVKLKIWRGGKFCIIDSIPYPFVFTNRNAYRLLSIY